jgi:hypothetical protein
LDASLHFKRLVADNIQEDGRFQDHKDEVYFVVHDDVGNPHGGDPRTNVIHMNQHELFTGMTDKFSFTGSANVVLWEQDPNNSDDRIDTEVIKTEKAGNYDAVFLNNGVYIGFRN